MSRHATDPDDRTIHTDARGNRYRGCTECPTGRMEDVGECWSCPQCGHSALTAKGLRAEARRILESAPPDRTMRR